ncbi:unnamed protein product [Paramecium sonneborni]|uniref:Uncharacterized protein n=1 Tax=Paramecium sonneborni TaxID=65129 RepID=A0A8S1N3I8_9CILI|nr:unnamed protein product [Paramecium sonneborni]
MKSTLHIYTEIKRKSKKQHHKKLQNQTSRKFDIADVDLVHFQVVRRMIDKVNQNKSFFQQQILVIRQTQILMTILLITSIENQENVNLA